MCTANRLCRFPEFRLSRAWPQLHGQKTKIASLSRARDAAGDFRQLGPSIGRASEPLQHHEACGTRYSDEDSAPTLTGVRYGWRMAITHHFDRGRDRRLRGSRGLRRSRRAGTAHHRTRRTGGAPTSGNALPDYGPLVGAGLLGDRHDQLSGGVRRWRTSVCLHGTFVMVGRTP